MQAETLNCPMCGASAASDASSCEHCGARLATVACPSCFGMIFEGAKFCSHCGAKVERVEVAADQPRPCPHCRLNLGAVMVGTTNLLECSKCEGVWVDSSTLKQICADRERQAVVLGMASPMPAAQDGAFEPVRYIHCPICQVLMNRVNFANCSHVIVDVCTQHGTWFDKDELRKVTEFIRDGGMDKSREREIAELKQQRSRAQIDPLYLNLSPELPPTTQRGDVYDAAFSLVSSALKSLFP